MSAWPSRGCWEDAGTVEGVGWQAPTGVRRAEPYPEAPAVCVGLAQVQDPASRLMPVVMQCDHVDEAGNEASQARPRGLCSPCRWGRRVLEALDSLARGGGGQRTAAFPGDILQGSRAAKAAICELGLPGDPSEPQDLRGRCSPLRMRGAHPHCVCCVCLLVCIKCNWCCCCRWSPVEQRELTRRRLLFLFYLLRSPFFDTFTR